MANKWLVHIKKTMRRMKAKKTYVKGKGLIMYSVMTLLMQLKPTKKYNHSILKK